MKQPLLCSSPAILAGPRSTRVAVCCLGFVRAAEDVHHVGFADHPFLLLVHHVEALRRHLHEVLLADHAFLIHHFLHVAGEVRVDVIRKHRRSDSQHRAKRQRSRDSLQGKAIKGMNMREASSGP